MCQLLGWNHTRHWFALLGPEKGMSAVRTVTAAWDWLHTRTATPVESSGPLIALPRTMVYVPMCRFVPPPAVGSSCKVSCRRLTMTPGVSSSSMVTVTRSVVRAV